MPTLRSSVVAVALVTAGVARLATAAEPPIPVSELREVRRMEVPPTLTVGASSTPFVFASEGAGVVYSLTQSGAVNVVDLATGELVRRVEQPPEAPVASQNGGAVIRYGDRAWLVTVESHWLYDSNPDVIFDAGEPRRPTFANLAPNCGGAVVGLPGVGAAVTIGLCAKLFGLDSGTESAELFDGRAWKAAVGGDPSAPILAVFLIDDRAGRSFYRFYRVADPRNPQLLAEVGANAVPLALWVDRSGEIVVDQDVTGLIRIRAISGALLGTITGHAYGSALAFADGSFGRVLVVRSGSDWEFYDLTDPTSPRLTGRFTPYWVDYPTEGPTVQRMVTLATRPWLVVAHQNPSGVDVIDVRTGALLDSYDAAPTRPTAIVADETVPTGPWVGVLGFEPESGARTFIGGLLRLDALRVDAAAHLESLSSFSRATPDVVRETAPIGGRYVAMLDLPAGVLAVGDTATGETVARTWLNPQIGSGGEAFLEVAGDRILAGTPWNLELFDWTDGALVARRFLPYKTNATGYTSVAVSASGAAALARGGEIRFFAPDGTETALPTFVYPTVHVEFSPDGTLLLASDDNPDAYYSVGLTVWDVSDPLAPRRLWIGPYQVTHGRFARGGATVVADYYGSASYGVAPVQLDARTGRQLAPAGPWQGSYGPVYRAQSLIEGAEPRFTFVTRAFSGSWFSVHFDPSFDTPRPLGDTGPYAFEPQAVPRADGKGWYEGFGDPSGGGPYAWQQFTIDGARGPADALGTADLVPLRYGFFLA